MPEMSLRQAAQHVGTSKSTILRAIQRGRLSATRDAEGSYKIDPAELLRVYPPDRLVPRSTSQSTPQHSTDVEVRMLRELLEAAKFRADELRIERDRWQATCERLLLSAPIVAPAPAAPTPVTTPQRRSWWKWWGDQQAS